MEHILEKQTLHNIWNVLCRNHIGIYKRIEFDIACIGVDWRVILSLFRGVTGDGVWIGEWVY
jgi:hypothetical protein